MKIKMLATISGMRNNEPWPSRGEVADFDDAEAAQLIATGLAVAVRAPEPDRPAPAAPEPEAPVEEAPVETAADDAPAETAALTTGRGPTRRKRTP